MSAAQKARGKGSHWTIARHVVQVAMLLLFASPVLAAGWSLLGLGTSPEDAVSTPAELPFFGTLSSTSIAGLTLMDPFATLEIAAASKSFELDWLLAALPILIVYGLVRGRAFCGWVCPVNLLLELVDALRKKIGIQVRETPLPRRTKIVMAAVVLLLSALTSVPVFETFSPVSAVNKGIVLGSTAGLWTLLAIVVAELFWGHRVWCRSLCPLGGFYEAIGRAGQLNVRIDHEACIHCSSCKKACICDPSILDPALSGDDVIVRAGDCMVCGKCIDACPTRALSYTVGRRRKPSAKTAATQPPAKPTSASKAVPEETTPDVAPGT